MRTSSVQWRILVRLLPLLALVFAVGAFWLGELTKSSLDETNLGLARRASDTAATAVETAMLAKRDADPWDVVGRRLGRREGETIEILDAESRIVFSTDPGQIGAVRGLDHPTCVVCHADGSTRGTRDSALVEPEDGDPYHVFAVPLENGPDCRRCHADDGDRLGIVLVRQSAAPARVQARTIRLGIAVAAAVALLFTFLMSRSLVLRIERQRDDFETLYRFSDQLSRTVLPADRRKRAVELANRFLGAECVLVRGERRAETGAGKGTITMVGPDGIDDHEFSFGPDGTIGVPTLLGSIVERWLTGEFDGQDEVEAGWVVAHPLERGGRRVGILLLPARKEGGRPPDPATVRALCRHIGIAVEFSDLQRELVGSERLAAIGETVAGLAHCLKNTLNGLRAGQYVVDRGLEQEKPEKVERGWKIAKSGIGHVERLALDMLYFVKARRPERTATDLNQVAGEVVDLLREAAASQGVRLELEADEAVGTPGVDRTAIYRAILNLVTNAIDACVDSEDGERVVVRTATADDEIVLEVTDDGVGMSEAIQARLFQRFFSTKAGKGTGLGLPVVKKIAEEHGGRLELESTEGEGTTFRIVLPRTFPPHTP